MADVIASRPKICFFAKVHDPEVLRRVEFYAQDIRILEELGFDVHVATNPRELVRADLYFGWWWTWAFLPLAAATFWRRPCVLTGVVDLIDFNRRPVWQQWMQRLAMKRATANVFVSQLEFQELPRRFRVSKPAYSPCIVDTATYRPDGARNKQLIVTIAWMQGINAERKSIPEVVQAAARVHAVHPEVQFVIAGERGTYYPKLAQMVKALGAEDYIEFPGAISKERKIELLQKCTLYLQPSRFEGFGLAILEAMSCGAPVVTSPAGAVPEVVGDAAVLVDGTSPEAIAGAVNRLLDDDTARQRLGHDARTRAESLFPYHRRKHDLQRIIEQVLRPDALGALQLWRQEQG